MRLMQRSNYFAAQHKTRLFICLGAFAPALREFCPYTARSGPGVPPPAGAAGLT